MTRILSIFISILTICSSCASHRMNSSFDIKKSGKSPDYNNSYYWASLPFKQDVGDLQPKGVIVDHIPEEVDVFFIHPTSFFNSKKSKHWNADIDDPKINKITDDGSIKYQSSIFNTSARVFAPRYRQACYNAFFTKDKKSAQQAFDLAYEDVYKAFLHYYDHWNNKRPIIIAGHSQGALMAIRLLKEVFDHKDMKNKLVVAYIVGYPVPIGTFDYLKVCKEEHQTSCICSWRTFKSGTEPKFLIKEKPVMITNPLSWTTDDQFVSKDKNEGMVIDMNKEITQHAVSAQIYKNILWSSKPHFRGSFLLWGKNYHKGDFNLYYMNVRENVRTRIRSFYKN